jgi:hypothetical protein
LKAILLNQPDFAASLDFSQDQYEEQQIHSWVDRVMKRSDLYRFEISNKDTDGIHPMVVLGYPGKKVLAILPEEKAYFEWEEIDLSRAAFTTLEGVDLYYLTKGLMKGSTRCEYVAEEEYRGHRCLKIRVTNDNVEAPGFGLEAMWLMRSPLYFFVAEDLRNLIIRLTVTNDEGKNEDVYVLKNISLSPDDIPRELFEVPSGFQRR